MEPNQIALSLYSIDGSEMQHVCMIIDLAPDIENTNSPTPMADILLAVPAVLPPNPIIAILTAI